jgi:hypothetical protein
MASACARERLKAHACWFAKDVDKRGRTTEQFTVGQAPAPTTHPLTTSAGRRMYMSVK